MCVTLGLCLHAVPEVEGSSAFLRLSVPNVERLAVILDLSEEELEGVLLEELQALVCYYFPYM